jgi:hypothetical protein
MDAKSASNSGISEHTSIRALFRALAVESVATGDAQGWLGRVRPVIAAAQEELRAQFAADGSSESLLRRRARLADDTVVGLLHMLSVFVGLRGGSMIAPMAAVAIGSYGRNALAPDADVQLLFLACEGTDMEPAARSVVAETVAALWDLGFTVEQAAGTPLECLELACQQAPLLAALADRRFLWGGYSLFGLLEAGLGQLMAGAFSADWRRVVGAVGGGALSRQPVVPMGPRELAESRRFLSVAREQLRMVQQNDNAPRIGVHRSAACTR